MPCEGSQLPLPGAAARPLAQALGLCTGQNDSGSGGEEMRGGTAHPERAVRGGAI